MDDDDNFKEFIPCHTDVLERTDVLELSVTGFKGDKIEEKESIEAVSLYTARTSYRQQITVDTNEPESTERGEDEDSCFCYVQDVKEQEFSLYTATTSCQPQTIAGTNQLESTERGEDQDSCFCYVQDEKEQRSTESKDECDFANIPEPEIPKEPEDENVALLPPDHPLMQKFQQSLREYLLRSKESLQSELDELAHQLKNKTKQREENGLRLYDMREKIGNQTEQLEEFTKNILETQEYRMKQESEVERLQEQQKSIQQQVKEQKSLYNKRLLEMENARTLDSNLTKWSESVEDEVKNAQRVVSRDAQLQRKISEEKRKSDLLFYQVDQEVKRNEREKEIVLGELTEMQKAVEMLNTSIANANSDLEALQAEHKRLNRSWNDVIIGISHRDKVLFQAQGEIGKIRECIKLNSATIDGIKKQITKELAQNEKLEAFKTRISSDYENLKRECQKETEALDKLITKLEMVPLLLKQTEIDLNEAKKEGIHIEAELRRINFKMDKKYQKKFEIEEMILKNAQDRLINDKASEYRLKILRNNQEKRRSMEINLSHTQNQLATTLLEFERMKSAMQKVREDNSVLNGLLANAEGKANNLQSEIKQMEIKIDAKLARLDKLMKQLDEILRTRDESASPTELKIKQVEKALHQAEQQIREHQQFWLMLQNHFVNLSQKRNQQLNEIQITRKQLAIIKQKSLKIDYDLEKVENSSRELNREIQNFRMKISLLNAKMQEKRSQHEAEESECELEHADLLERLKNHEMQVLEVEEEINDLNIEITQYKDLVLEKHRETLSWETKYKMIEETLRWRKDEQAAESEISQMKAEIHRMEIRFQQLQRAQEKLVQDLDHAVLHREQIFTSTRTKQVMENKLRSKTNATMKQKVNDMRIKIQKSQTEIKTIKDINMKKAAEEYETMQVEVRNLRQEVVRLSGVNQQILAEIEECVVSKRLNLEKIVRKQSRAKAYHACCHCSQTVKMPRSAEVLDAAERKQMDLIENLNDLLQSLMNDFPQKKPLFEKILEYLK